MISRSGSLGTLICLQLTRAGIGQSTFIGIGGDPMLGTTTRDALQALDEDKGTDAAVIVGEIGGGMEETAAAYAKRMKKPAVAFIAGAGLGAEIMQSISAVLLEVGLSYGLAALLYLVTEELLVEAHEEPVTPAASGMFFLGFLIFLLLGMAE